MFGLTLTHLGYESMAPLKLSQDQKLLQMSPFSTNTGLFSQAHDIEDAPGNVFGNTGDTMMKTYFLLDEKVNVVHQAERPFFLITFLY